MKYTVIVARINDYPRSSYFIDAVNQAIADGWKPLGGVAVGGGFYYQAMIKEENGK